MTRSHRGAVRIAFGKAGSQAASASGKDVDDEAARACSEKEDTGGLGDEVMAGTVTCRKRTLPDESDERVVPIHPRRGGRGD
jgi:hypothetical protein